MTARQLVPGTLRARLSLLAAAAVLGVLVLAGTGLVVAQREILTDALDDTLAAQARMVADRLAAGERIGPSVPISEEFSLEVLTDDGDLLGDVTGDAGPLPRAPLHEEGDGDVDEDGDEATVELDEGPARLLTTEEDGVTIRVAASLEDVSESTGALGAALAVALAAAAAVLLVASVMTRARKS